jgi:hypothetical protein
MSKSSRKPTHKVFAVTERSEGKKNSWQEVGVCWAHENHGGLNLKLSYLPLHPCDLVIMTQERLDQLKAEGKEGGDA